MKEMVSCLRLIRNGLETLLNHGRNILVPDPKNKQHVGSGAKEGGMHRAGQG